MAEADLSGRWSVLLVDDHASFSTMVQLWFERDDRFQVVGIAGDGDEAVDLAAALRPHVVILDDEMPNLTGLEALSQIREVSAASQIIATPRRRTTIVSTSRRCSAPTPSCRSSSRSAP